MTSGLVIAILAAIVASQAMITGAFQLLMQVMNMSYAPHIKLVSNYLFVLFQKSPSLSETSQLKGKKLT